MSTEAEYAAEAGAAVAIIEARQELDKLTAERDQLAAQNRVLIAKLESAIAARDYAFTILPPPRAVVSATYLTPGTGGPKIIVEVCPYCTAATGDDSRMCVCRVQCTYAACRHDDPMTILVTGREEASDGA